ncbi:MAG: hypothetical protein RXR18_01175 [Nitrososphaeria archaeon]
MPEESAAKFAVDIIRVLIIYYAQGLPDTIELLYKTLYILINDLR